MTHWRGRPDDGARDTLRRLYLTLLVRGRSSRGLVTQSLFRRLFWKMLVVLGAGVSAGVAAFLFVSLFGDGSLFLYSLALHAITFVFTLSFVTRSGGIFPNCDEANALLHRPIAPRVIVLARTEVVVGVALTLAVALNVVGIYIGADYLGGGLHFVVAHLVSTALGVLLVVGTVSLIHGLLLRSIGQSQRLVSAMVTADLVLALLVIAGSVAAWRHAMALDGPLELTVPSSWLAFLPTVWFASLNEVLAGQGPEPPWALAAIGLAVTSLVVGVSFSGLLGGAYEHVFERLLVGVSDPPRTRRPWLALVAAAPPFRFWPRDPALRSAFWLTAAYLLRDRSVRLRLYPRLAAAALMPALFLLMRGDPPPFPVGMLLGAISLVPLSTLDTLRTSEHWQAGDVFRCAPLVGPGRLCRGASAAVLWFVCVPLVGWFVMWGLLLGMGEVLLLGIPALFATPVVALVPCLGGKFVPLSRPVEVVDSSVQGLFIVPSAVWMGLTFLGLYASQGGWLPWLLLAEAVVVVWLYRFMTQRIDRTLWVPIERGG